MRVLPLLPLAIVTALLGGVPAAAQNQAELNASAGRSLAVADKALNKTYARLMARLSRGSQARLRTAQRAWIASRDATCNFVSNGPDAGSVAAMVTAGCLTTETRARTERLAGFVTCPEGDVACPR